MLQQDIKACCALKIPDSHSLRGQIVNRAE